MPNRRTAEVLSWLVIFALVGLVVYSNLHRPEQSGSIRVNDLRLKLIGQELIGFRTLQRWLGQGNATPVSNRWRDSSERLIGSMDAVAATPQDRFHVAIITGEVLGPDHALPLLDAFSREPTDAELAADIAAIRQIYASGAASLDAESRERLVRRHDFFAQVALTHGCDPAVEPRKSLEQAAARTVVVLSAVSLTLLGAIAISLGLFTTGIVLYKRGKIRRAYIPNPSAGSVFLETFALYLALFVMFSLLIRAVGAANMNWNWLGLLILPIAMLWAQRRGLSIEEYRKGVGWHSGQGWMRELAAGIGGYIAGLVVVAVGLLITGLLVRFSGASPQHPIIQLLRGSAWQIMGLYGLACVFAPVLEETMFRGALFHHLRSRWRWVFAAPTVAAIFAIVHPQGWAALPALGAIAVVLAGIREWRGTIIASVAAHALNNFIALTLALLFLR